MLYPYTSQSLAYKDIFNHWMALLTNWSSVPEDRVAKLKNPLIKAINVSIAYCLKIAYCVMTLCNILVMQAHFILLNHTFLPEQSYLVAY